MKLFQKNILMGIVFHTVKKHSICIKKLKKSFKDFTFLLQIKTLNNKKPRLERRGF